MSHALKPAPTRPKPAGRPGATLPKKRANRFATFEPPRPISLRDLETVARNISDYGAKPTTILCSRALLVEATCAARIIQREADWRRLGLLPLTR